MSCGVGCRHGSDPAVHRPAATAPIRPLAWEPPYAVGAALEKDKKKKKKKLKKLGSLNLSLSLSGMCVNASKLTERHLCRTLVWRKNQEELITQECPGPRIL